MGRGRDLNPAVLAHIAARVAEGWNVGRLHRELPSVKRGTLKRKVTSIRRGDSGARKQYSARRTKELVAGRRRTVTHSKGSCDVAEEALPIAR